VTQISARVEGNKWIITATWLVPDDDGDPTDPDTVVFTTRRLTETTAEPDGDPDEYTYGVDAEVTRDSEGVYAFAFVPPFGQHAVHAQGTGEAYGAGEIRINVTKSKALA
jgi:hypothetical protein